MIRINLLPHRAEKRKRRKVQFAALSGVSVAVGVLLVGLGYLGMQARIFYQNERNNYLNREIAKLDKQIEEIKRLRQQVKALLARKEVVEKLQSTRSDVVHLMDQMLRILPRGVYLSSLRQRGYAISITGFAQSSARVSTLMRAIDESPWLDSPHLIEVAASTEGTGRTNRFTMTFNLSKEPPPNPSPLGKRTAPASAPAAASATLAASAPAAVSAPVAASAPAAAAPASAPVKSDAVKPAKKAQLHKKRHSKRARAAAGTHAQVAGEKR